MEEQGNLMNSNTDVKFYRTDLKFYHVDEKNLIDILLTAKEVFTQDMGKSSADHLSYLLTCAASRIIDLENQVKFLQQKSLEEHQAKIEAERHAKHGDRSPPLTIREHDD